jgi:hypothetical protein
LAGGGVVLEAAAVITYQYGNSSLFLLGTGFLAQIASIPFFVSAGINKHKAKKASISFNLKKIPGRQPAMGFPSKLQLAVKIPL